MSRMREPWPCTVTKDDTGRKETEKQRNRETEKQRKREREKVRKREREKHNRREKERNIMSGRKRENICQSPRSMGLTTGSITDISALLSHCCRTAVGPDR